jgi:hypothetical protein
MRGGKSFLILLVVAAGLGAYVYFVESKRDVSDTPAVKHDKVWTVDANKLEEIDIKASNGDLTKVKKNGPTWQIVSPEPMEADADAINTIATALSSLESTKTVDDNPPSVKPFDLDPPHASITLKVAGESAPKQIDLGTKTPTGSDMYARVAGQPKVFLIGATLDDQLNRTTFDLRDKTLLKFDRDKADSLKLEPAGAAAVSLAKKSSEEWRLASPVDARGDFSAIDGLVSKLSQAKMKSVVANDAGNDLKKYGFDKPQEVVTVGAGSTRASLAFGAKSPDGALYARDLSRPIVFTVDAALLDDVKKKPDDLRQKMLFEFRSFTATSVDVTHGAESFSFVKQTAPSQPNQSSVPAETWKMTKPAAKDVDQTKLTDFLVNVANLKADTFVDRAAGTGDEYVFAVRFGDAKSPKDERVTFRKSGTTVQGVRQGEPGAAVVSTADFDKVAAGLKELTGGK